MPGPVVLEHRMNIKHQLEKKHTNDVLRTRCLRVGLVVEVGENCGCLNDKDMETSFIDKSPICSDL